MAYKLYKGSTNITKVYKGSTNITKIYKGSSLIWNNVIPLEYNLAYWYSSGIIYSYCYLYETYYPKYQNDALVYFVNKPDSSGLYFNGPTETENPNWSALFINYKILSFSNDVIYCSNTGTGDSYREFSLTYYDTIFIQNVPFKRYKGVEPLSGENVDLALPDGFEFGKSIYLQSANYYVKSSSSSGYRLSNDDAYTSDVSLLQKGLKIDVLSGGSL